MSHGLFPLTSYVFSGAPPGEAVLIKSSDSSQTSQELTHHLPIKPPLQQGQLSLQLVPALGPYASQCPNTPCTEW